MFKGREMTALWAVTRLVMNDTWFLRGITATRGVLPPWLGGNGAHPGFSGFQFLNPLPRKLQRDPRLISSLHFLQPRKSHPVRHAATVKHPPPFIRPLTFPNSELFGSTASCFDLLLQPRAFKKTNKGKKPNVPVVHYQSGAPTTMPSKVERKKPEDKETKAVHHAVVPMAKSQEVTQKKDKTYKEIAREIQSGIIGYHQKWKANRWFGFGGVTIRYGESEGAAKGYTLPHTMVSFLTAMRKAQEKAQEPSANEEQLYKTALQEIEQLSNKALDFHFKWSSLTWLFHSLRSNDTQTFYERTRSICAR